MAKAVWPEEHKWDGDDSGKVSCSDDGRVVIHMALRYGAPETWNVIVMVYGPGGRADERQGWFDLTLTGSFADVVARAKAVTFASELVDHTKVPTCP